jgi:hypothetical protein
VKRITTALLSAAQKAKQTKKLQRTKERMKERRGLVFFCSQAVAV